MGWLIPTATTAATYQTIDGAVATTLGLSAIEKRKLLRNSRRLGHMEKYKSYADEAMQLAASARKPDDRRFWLNIARAWLGLLEMWGKR